jgi:nucleoside-diphosphate-sugar epimerase
MSKPIVIVTGASGFIGSAVCIDLANDFLVVAIDRREPTLRLMGVTPQVLWHILDISDNLAVSELFAQIKIEFGRIDFVIHLAAYYDFRMDWVGEYQRTNISGTLNLLKACKDEGVKRLIFASSIAAMEPSDGSSFLTEGSPTSEFTPYARSKSLGEKLVEESRDQVPYTILRIAGVFSDWCELPPLYGLIKLWTFPFPFGCMIPGLGNSGIPYIHLNDLVSIVRKCIVLDHKLGPSQIFLASPKGAVLHRQLFPAIRSESTYPLSLKPIHINKKFAKTGLRFRRAMGAVTGNLPYERPWMLDYADMSWSVDNAITRRILNWDCTPGLGILQKIPEIMSNLRKDPKGWESKNISRNERRFNYSDE